MNLSACPSSDSRAVTLALDEAEFARVFGLVFQMSDGSSLELAPPESAPDGPSALLSGTMSHVLSLMRDVGIQVSLGGRHVTVCENDLLKVLMLSSLGNFVNRPQDAEIGRPGSIATVVFDVYTGRLVVVTPYSIMRSYFLETLLIISVIALTRLSMVRKLTITMPAGG